MSEFKYVSQKANQLIDLLMDHSKKPVIHDFTQIIEATEKTVTDRRIKELPTRPKPIVITPSDDKKKRHLLRCDGAHLSVSANEISLIRIEKKLANHYRLLGDNLAITLNGNKSIYELKYDIVLEEIKNAAEEEYAVYRIGDVYEGRRVKMKNLGLDIGTKTIVVAYKDGNKTNYISEINGYWPFERATPFIEHMLNDPKKTRADGSIRPARYIKLDSGRIIVLGRDAEEFAYAKNDTLLRPMSEGGISADEEAMTVLASIIHGLLATAETELGEFDDEVNVCYCTTAPAINKESNLAYHERVVNMILDSYQSKSKLKHTTIKESHAIVLNMSPDGTGIGISWGAGTVTVSYVRYGIEIYSFCYVGAGDWIDEQVAMRHGYNPQLSKTMKKVSKETPTTVSKRKTEVDLTPGKEPEDRVGLDIALHYDVLISQVIDGIVTGFLENEANAKIDAEINIYMAGGTSSPKGFTKRVEKKLAERETPFGVGKILIADKPLFCVAEGLLKAAEMS